MHACPCDYVSQSFTHTQTVHPLSLCPSTTSKWDRNISTCVFVVAGKTWRTHKDKASHAILGKAVQRESVAQRWLVCGIRKLHWNPFKSRGCNFWKSHEERRFPPQSQPLSFIMWDSSMINFPSLYFWLNSKACSCRRKVCHNYYKVNQILYHVYSLLVSLKW